MLSAGILGVPVALFFTQMNESFVLRNDIVPLLVLLSGAVAAVALGALPALSPPGLLPMLVLIVVLLAMWGDVTWADPLPVIGIVLLSVLVHFVGPLNQRKSEEPRSTEDWNDGIRPGRAEQE